MVSGGSNAVTCVERKRARRTRLLSWFGRWFFFRCQAKPGQMAGFDFLGNFPKTAENGEYVLLEVDIFRKHAEGYAITKAE